MDDTTTGELTFAQATALLERHGNKLANAMDDLAQAENEAHLRTSFGQLAAFETEQEKDAVRARWQRNLELADDAALKVAERVRKDTARIKQQLESPGSLSLTDGEWQRAGSMTPIVERQARSAPLAEVLAQVRNAYQRNDRAAMAAWLEPARERLRAPITKGNDGRVAIPESDDVRADLARVLGTVKDSLTDTSAKPVKERLAKVVGQSGDLSGRVMRRRTERELAKQIASGEKIPFPTAGARR